MSDPRQKLTGQQVADAGLDDWRLVLGTLRARFRTDDFASAARLTQRVGEAAEEADHHPDLDLRWGRLDVSVASHDVGGITSRDLDLARQVSALAADEGARPDTASLQAVELGLDTAHADRLGPFWAAVLGGEVGGDEVTDKAGDVPTLWFQATDEHDEPRQRFHLDVWVPPEQVQPRIDAALAAGGSLVSDAEAPSFWVLADPDGNKACLCTWQHRG
jgi:4a-hydroxytetrahydrobiopterin dehydratase